MWDIVALVTLIFSCLMGVLLTAVRLPGTWLIVIAALVYGWWADWEGVGPVLAAVVAGIAIVGEAVELILSAFTARRAGATRQAVWGGLIGGFLGMVFLSSLLTLPLLFVGTLIGAVAGALVGCFGGAMLVELVMRRKLVQGTKVGLFSALGFALGMVTKIALALVMSGLLIASVVSSPRGSTPPIPQPSSPSAAP